MKKRALSTLPSSSRVTATSPVEREAPDYLEKLSPTEQIVLQGNADKTIIVLMAKMLKEQTQGIDEAKLPQVYEEMLCSEGKLLIRDLEDLALFLTYIPREHWEIVKNNPHIIALIEQRKLVFHGYHELTTHQSLVPESVSMHADLVRAIMIACNLHMNPSHGAILSTFCEWIAPIIKDLPLSSYTWTCLVTTCTSSAKLANLLLNDKLFKVTPDLKAFVKKLSASISERFNTWGLRALIQSSSDKLDIATYFSWLNRDNHFMLRDEIVKALALDGSEAAYVSMQNQLSAMNDKTIQRFILSLEPNNQFNLAKQWHKIMPALPVSSQSDEEDTSALGYEDRFVVETSHLPPLPQDLTHAGLWAHMLEMYHLDLPPSTSKAREIDTKAVASLVSGSDRANRVFSKNDLFEIYVFVSGNRLGLAENYQYEQVDIRESRLYAYLYQLEQHFQQLTNCQFYVRKKEGEGKLFDGVCTGKYIEEQRILIVGGFQFNISPLIRMPLSFAVSPSVIKSFPHATAPSSSTDNSQPSQGGHFARTGMKKTTSFETKPLPNTMSLQM